MSIRSRLRIRTRLRSLAYRIQNPKPKPLILMYHRIADEAVDNWGLCVSPAQFEEHLRVIRRTRYPLPLSKFVSDLMAGTLRPDAVALTFDDGYVDNLLSGRPRLVASDVPATVFLATGYLDRPGEFWWDELARLVLLGSSPASIELVVHGERMIFDLCSKSIVRRNGTVDAAILKKRQSTLTAVWQIVRRLEDEERELAMAQLRPGFTLQGQGAARARAMTSDEVRRLVKDGLVSVGAHTVTHPILPELDAAARERELVESKRTAEALIGGPVTGFAYPYGELDAKSRAAVAAAGFKFGCAGRYEPAASTSDIFALPRIHVRNWNGDVFDRALRLASVGIRASFPSGVSLFPTLAYPAVSIAES